MNTQLKLSVNKTVAYIAIIAMTFTQVVPAGYAAQQTLLTNEQGQRIYSIDVDEVENTDPIPAYEAQGTHEAFFAKGALSAAVMDKVEDEIVVADPVVEEEFDGNGIEVPIEVPNVPWLDCGDYIVHGACPANEEALVEAREILGADVAAGRWLVDMYADGRNVTTYIFYDDDGNLLGRKTLEGDNITWTDAENNVIEDPRIAEIRETVLADLENTMGLTREELEALIKSIEVIEVNYREGNVSYVNVIFKEGKMGEARLIDVIGSGDLPSGVTYTFQNQKIVHANLEWDRELRDHSYPREILMASISYDENGKITQIRWQNADRVPDCARPGAEVICLVAILAPTPLFEDNYEYLGDQITITRQYADDVSSPWFGGEPNENTTKTTKIKRMIMTLTELEDGKHHITKLEEFAANGNVVTSTFKWQDVSLQVGAPCEINAAGEVVFCPSSSPQLHLTSITRRDADGLISTISSTNPEHIFKMVNPPSLFDETTAFVTITDWDKVHEVEYTSLEDLLVQVRVLEAEAPVVNEYYKLLAEFDEFMSGILLEGITLERVLEMRLELDELKLFIEEIMEDDITVIDELVKEYEVRTKSLNQQLAKRLLIVTIGESTLEVNIAEAMRILSEEYVRMRTEDSIDYTRLEGVDAADIEGLETFAEYLAATQIGVETTMPMFNALSSLGNLVLIERLLQKYADRIVGPDNDSDGTPEVNFTIFRRMINGTQVAHEAAMALIKKIRTETGLEFPTEGPVSFDELKRIAETITSLNEELKEAAETLVNDFTIEAVFSNQVMREIQQEIQKIYSQNVYVFQRTVRNISTEIKTIIEEHNIQFPTESTISYEELMVLVAAVESLREELESRLTELLDGLDADSRVKSTLLWRLEYKLTQYSGAESYREIYRKLEDVISQKGVTFTIGDKTVTVSRSDFDAMTGALPRSISSLLQFPGIRETLSEAVLKTLDSWHAESERSRVDLRDRTVGDVKQFSYLGVRIQLMQKLLEAYGDSVLTDGFVDSDLFRRKLLMSRELEKLFDDSAVEILRGIKRVTRIAENSNGALTTEQYETLYRILQESNDAVKKIIAGEMSGIIREARDMVTAMLNEKFNVLVKDVDALVNTSRVRITIDGTEYLIDASGVMADINNFVKMVAISFNGVYTNEQIGRLNGIAESVLKQLRSTGELQRIRTLNLYSTSYSHNSGLNQTSANQEYWFRLVPSILEAFGTEIVVDGEISNEKIQDKLLEDVNAPVERGESLLAAFRDFLNAKIAEGKAALNGFDFSIWEDRLAAEDYMYEFIKNFQNEAQDLIGPLSDSEISQLTAMANNTRYGESTRDMQDLWYLFTQKMKQRVVTVTMPDGSVIQVNLNDIGSIPGFPRNHNFDEELFVGINDTDFDDAEKRNQLNLLLSKTEDTRVRSTSFDRDRFIINVITRIFGELEQIPELFRENFFPDQGDFLTVNREKLRRLLKGIDVLHRDILNEATGWIEEAVEEIEALKTLPMTTTQIRAIQAAIRALQMKLINYMNELTEKHEKQDVMEMEEAVTAVYKQVIDSLIAYVRSHPLVYVHNGVEVTIPTAELSERILEVIKEKFPEEEIGAHHFAYFFGISMADVRAYDKLEGFLGMQIIALPRNSQYVEILSKLSEIGMMELMEDAVARYADDVISGNPPQVNAELLVELLIDPEVAVDRAMQKADAFLEDLLEKMEAIELPLTSASFAELKALTENGKMDFIQTMNDFVAGFTQEMFDEVQGYVRELYHVFVALRNDYVLTTPIQITAQDGSTFELILEDLEGPAVERIMMLLMQQGHFGNDEVSQEELDYLASLENSTEPEIVELITIEASYYGSYSSPARRVVEPARMMWFPLAPSFDPDAMPTEFGFYTLLIRLAEKYGNYVVDHAGNFDAGRFLAELDRTDYERAEARFKEIKVETIAAMEALLPQPETAAVSLDDVAAIHEFLDAAREKFLKYMHIYKSDKRYGDPVTKTANNAWYAVITQYEELLWNRPILVDLGGQTVIVDGKALVDIIREEYNKQNTDVIDRYLEGGEQNYEYDNFKTLYRNIYYREAVEDKVEVGEIDDDAFEDSRYPFTLGLLQQLDGITSKDLAGLDTESKDQLKLTLIDNLKEQLRGMLNMRVFAPGAQIQSIGFNNMPQASAEVSGMVAFLSSGVSYSRVMGGSLKMGRVYYDDSYWNPTPPKKYLYLSKRDQLFRVLPAILKDYKDIVINADGKVDLGKFRSAVAGDYDLPEGGLEQIAENLAVNVEDILSVDAEKRDYEGCKINGCATWSRYVSVWVKIDGERKHFSGVVNGGSYEKPRRYWGYYDEPIIKIAELLNYGYVTTSLSFEAELTTAILERSVDTSVSLGSSVMRTELLEIETPKILNLDGLVVKESLRGPKVSLLETDPMLDGRAVEAIADAADTSISNLVSIDLSNVHYEFVCIKAPCPSPWTADLKVVVKTNKGEKRTFIGTIRHAEGESTIELTDLEEVQKAKMRKIVLADLEKTMGFSREELAALIESIEVNVLRNTVSITFKKDKMGDTRLIDVFGSSDLPAKVTYTLDIELLPMYVYPPVYVFKIASAEMQWADGIHADIRYLKGKIGLIDWSQTGFRGNCNELMCTGAMFAFKTHQYTDVYDYNVKNEITITRHHGNGLVLGEKVNFDAQFVQTPWDQRRDVLTLKMKADGEYYLSKLEQRGWNGKVMTSTEFKYDEVVPKSGGELICSPCAVNADGTPMGNCECFMNTTTLGVNVFLRKVTRKDGEGNVLSITDKIRSNIAYIQPEGQFTARPLFDGTMTGIVNTRDGLNHRIYFTDFKSLLEAIKKVEAEVAMIRSMAINDLVVTFGLNREELNRWLSEGLVTLEIDRSTGALAVIFDKSLQGKKITGGLVDPLGVFVIPAKIQLFFIDSLPPVTEYTNTPAEKSLVGVLEEIEPVKFPVLTYQGPRFQITWVLVYYKGSGVKTIVVNYANNNAVRAQHFDATVPSCAFGIGGVACQVAIPAPTKIVEIRRSGFCPPNAYCILPSNMLMGATVTYPRSDGIAERVIYFKHWATQIQSVDEYAINSKGVKVKVATNTYSRKVFGPGLCVNGFGFGYCTEPKYALTITRTDAEGNETSTIRVNLIIDKVAAEGEGANLAQIILVGGDIKWFRYDTEEQLFDLARKFESSMQNSEVVYKSSFGEGSLVIEKRGDVQRLRIFDSEGNELKSYEIASYEELRGYKSRWYSSARLKVVTTSVGVIDIRSYSYNFGYRTWGFAYYKVTETIEIEGIGTVNKSTTVRLTSDELKKTAESFYVIEKRTFGMREFTFRRSLQHRYWSYDRAGNERSSYLSRRTKDGSSVTVRKTRKTDGSYKHRVTVYKRGEGIIMKKTLSHIDISSGSANGLVVRNSWVNSPTSGQNVIITGGTIHILGWAELQDLSPIFPVDLPIPVQVVPGPTADV